MSVQRKEFVCVGDLWDALSSVSFVPVLSTQELIALLNQVDLRRGSYVRQVERAGSCLQVQAEFPYLAVLTVFKPEKALVVVQCLSDEIGWSVDKLTVRASDVRQVQPVVARLGIEVFADPILHRVARSSV